MNTDRDHVPVVLKLKTHPMANSEHSGSRLTWDRYKVAELVRWAARRQDFWEALRLGLDMNCEHHAEL